MYNSLLLSKNPNLPVLESVKAVVTTVVVVTEVDCDGTTGGSVWLVVTCVVGVVCLVVCVVSP